MDEQKDILQKPPATFADCVFNRRHLQTPNMVCKQVRAFDEDEPIENLRYMYLIHRHNVDPRPVKKS